MILLGLHVCSLKETDKGMLGSHDVCSKPCMFGAQERVSCVADNISILGMYAEQVI